MGERSIVQSIREGGAKPPRTGGLVDLLLGVVALAAVGALGYFGVSWWTSQGGSSTAAAATMPQASVMTASLAPTPWTESDTARCQRAGRAASEGDSPIAALLPNPAVVDGFSSMATVLACRITTKSERFCDPAEKSALVAMVNDYLLRVDLIVAGLKLEGAPIAIMGEMMGGEVAFGSAVHDMMLDDTIDVMRHYHKDVADGLKSLAQRGVITAGDFSSFMGYGIPKSITEILGGIEPTSRICG